MKETLVFVDLLEDDTARLIAGTQSFSLPRTLLPPDAVEGSWVKLGATVVPAPPDDTEQRRHRLGRDDPGGEIKL
jgi:hypothetical protein